MSQRKWETDFNGTKILVKKGKKTGQLYIDNWCVDSNSTELIPGAGAQQILSGRFDEDGDAHTVDVFAKPGLFRDKVQIVIDGQPYAGDF